MGWAFKTTSTSTTKQNLLVFLTPHIVRSREDLERITIDRREQFGQAAGDDLALEGNEREAAEEQGIALAKLRGHNPVRGALVDHRDQYPVESYRQLGQDRVSRRELGPPSTAAPEVRYRLQAGVFASELDATESLTRVLESGHDASLVTTQVNGKLIYEIHVGPFGELDDARAARALLRGSLGVESSVMVLGEE
jgi:hypothetical protein